jgi:hypothetical protein
MRWGSMLSWLLYSDPTDELLMIIGIFTHFFALETTLAERQFFRALAKLIGKRSARLSACGIAAIAKQERSFGRGVFCGRRWFFVQCAYCDFEDLCVQLAHLRDRNTQDSQTECMKDFRTFFGDKGL